ncbi:MAG: hypothetical protein AAF741_04465 [Bacteroidota bacterium]
MLLLTLFSRLTRSEYHAFLSWLAHRRHRKLKRYRDVCSYLWSDLAKLGEPFATLDLEQLYERCFPDRPYKDAHWRRFSHELRLELETFLLDRKNARDEDRLIWDRLDLYRKLDLERHYTLTLSKARRAIEASDKCGAEQLLQAYQLERTAYRSGLLQTERTGSNNLTDHSELLDRAILALRLRQICEQLSAARLQIDKGQALEIQANNLIEQAIKFEDEPAISVYAKAAQLYTSTRQDEGDRHFDTFQHSLAENLHRFKAEEQRDLLLIAINHGLRQANAGRREYLPKLFELYRKGLEEEILLEHGRLSIFTFNNAFGASIHVDRMDWAEDYLFTLQNRLPKGRGEEVVALAKARMAYIKKDYDQVLTELQKADYRDFIHHMTARLTQLKAYLALDYYHLAESLISGTRQLLRRHSDRSYHYKNYRNIFTLAARVLKLSPGTDQAREKLINRIQQTQPCTEKRWLLEQIEPN